MKKLLSLLSVLTISGTAIPTTIAASPYQKEEQLNNNINYSQTNNLEKLNRNKRDVFNWIGGAITDAGIWIGEAANKVGKHCFEDSKFGTAVGAGIGGGSTIGGTFAGPVGAGVGAAVGGIGLGALQCVSNIFIDPDHKIKNNFLDSYYGNN